MMEIFRPKRSKKEKKRKKKTHSSARKAPSARKNNTAPSPTKNVPADVSLGVESHLFTTERQQAIYAAVDVGVMQRGRGGHRGRGTNKLYGRRPFVITNQREGNQLKERERERKIPIPRPFFSLSFSFSLLRSFSPKVGMAADYAIELLLAVA